MNLKNNLFIKKTVEVGQKNVRILIFTMLYLKEKKNTWRYYFTPVYQNLDGMNYKSWDIGRDRLKLVIMGYFLPSPL